MNASPDLSQQIENFPALWPPPDQVRGSRIDGVMLTNADLDHTLGLFLLREGECVTVHASQPIRESLQEGLAVDAVLSHYGGLRWQEPPTELSPLCTASGEPSGLLYAAFPLSGRPPRYRESQPSAGASPGPLGDCIGYRFQDEATGGRLVVMPELLAIDDQALAQMEDCDLLLLDGTFWSENEMSVRGAGHTPAVMMGHLPVGGPSGSLATIAPLPIPRKVYLHINNTNPMLLPHSAERAQVEAAGVLIGQDGQEWVL